MNTLQTIETLSARTNIKFELINGFIVPKEDSVPLSQEMVEYILYSIKLVESVKGQ